jgi:hypothetical protein
MSIRYSILYYEVSRVVIIIYDARTSTALLLYVKVRVHRQRSKRTTNLAHYFQKQPSLRISLYSTRSTKNSSRHNLVYVIYNVYMYST